MEKNLEQIQRRTEEKIKRRQNKKQTKMVVSGKSVLNLQRIMIKKKSPRD